MNTWIGIGRLTADPEIRYVQASGTVVANFSIAIDRKYKREGAPTADFFNCSAFGKTAEFCEKYVKKGTKLVVTGRIQNDSYEKDGQKKTSTKIMVDSLEFAESKSATEAANSRTKEAVQPPTDSLEDELPFS